jgi:glucosamine--fructose-6-phosphate aminotransferase (isomerizing)
MIIVSNIQRLSLEVEELLLWSLKGDTQVRECDYVIEIPETSDALSPLITTTITTYHTILRF